MLKDKRVSVSLPDLRDVIGLIIHFSEPLLAALAQGDVLVGTWQPGDREWRFEDAAGR